MSEGSRRPLGSGAADWAERSSERGDDTGVARASTGDASGGAPDPQVDRGGKAQPGARRAHRRPPADPPPMTGHRPARPRLRPPPRRAAASARATKMSDEWRHEPVAPIDETNPLKSLGRAVADTLTNSEDPAAGAEEALST